LERCQLTALHADVVYWLGPQDAEKKRKRKSPAEAGPSQKFGVAEYQQHMRVRLLVGCRKVTLCRNCGQVSKNATDRIGRLW
jgi:hypothetical protein